MSKDNEINPEQEQIQSSTDIKSKPSPPWKNILHFILKRRYLAVGIAVFIIAIILGGILYWQDLQSKIYIEKSEIYAPIISLSPKNTGDIEKLYVKEGDRVIEGQTLAKIGGQIITARTPGIILWVQNTPGQIVSSQSAVIKMVDPLSLRVVGHIQEDKGLRDIHTGQRVTFTADAFGSQQYQGVVESVATTSRESSITFSISDKREEKEFDITVSFDTNAYPELKNGMSAKMWIYK